MAEQRLCSIEDCDNLSSARGWCDKHYMAWRRKGDPLAYKAKDDLKNAIREFYFERVRKCDTDKCLIWPFSKTKAGYPMARIVGAPYRWIHQSACHVRNGPRPSRDKDAAHSCGNPSCCNPRHLRWASRKENMSDQFQHGTISSGSRNGQAKLTEADVIEIRWLAHVATQRKIAQSFNVSFQTVSRIVRGELWKNVK